MGRKQFLQKSNFYKNGAWLEKASNKNKYSKDLTSVSSKQKIPDIFQKVHKTDRADSYNVQSREQPRGSFPPVARGPVGQLQCQPGTPWKSKSTVPPWAAPWPLHQGGCEESAVRMGQPSWWCRHLVKVKNHWSHRSTSLYRWGN